MGDEIELEAFVVNAARLVDLRGRVDSYGVCRIFRGNVNERGCDVGVHASRYWVAVNIALPSVPPDTIIKYAPEGSYLREKLLEDTAASPLTCDALFDRNYLLLGAGASRLAQAFSQHGREAMVEATPIRPDVTWLELSPPRTRQHILASPPLSTNDEQLWPRLGTAAFTPEAAAAALVTALTLAERLERS